MFKCWKAALKTHLLYSIGKESVSYMCRLGLVQSLLLLAFTAQDCPLRLNSGFSLNYLSKYIFSGLSFLSSRTFEMSLFFPSSLTDYI